MYVYMLQLKPYVSYRVKEVTQSEFTAKDLFDATYGQEAVSQYSSDELDLDNITAEEFLKIEDEKKSK